MQFTKKTAELFLPDGGPETSAYNQTTHLAIGAHQDDVEFMAYSGIAECFGQKGKGFSAVITTDGGGSPRSGIYADFSDERMIGVRRGEQKRAAEIGQYKFLALLMYTSAEIKDKRNFAPTADLIEILKKSRPKTVYTHNLADKHDTHVATAAKVIAAIRALPTADRPEKLIGCEAWRGLDWLEDGEKVIMDCSGRPDIAAAVMGVFDSQISGGKRYDVAALGRREANATYFESHSVDKYTQVLFGMDLTPLILDDTLDPSAYALQKIDAFKTDVAVRMKKYF